MHIHVARPGVPATNLHVTIQKNPQKVDEPPTFILPGGPGADHTAYQGYACLNRVSDLVFHDPRGCGLSDKGPCSTYSMHNYIDDVEAIRQALSLPKINIVGKSYGAMCGLGYALRYPHAVQKLVLAAGAPSYRFLEKAKQNLSRLGNQDQIAICEKLWSGNFTNREELLKFLTLTNPLYSVKARREPQAFDLITKSKRLAYDVLNEGFRQQYWHFDFEEKLPQIACKTLILIGKEDWITDISCSELMAASIPQSQLIVFNEASHAMEVDVAGEYFQRIARFIDS